ncbi:hypothetical protein Ddc_06555 [Ditylenchus destructor]|nr:hypothetical protein Ddc_06555 [Ditylenchus destructor]
MTNCYVLSELLETTVGFCVSVPEICPETPSRLCLHFAGLEELELIFMAIRGNREFSWLIRSFLPGWLKICTLTLLTNQWQQARIGVGESEAFNEQKNSGSL